ncbi:MAG: ankyrin repeat domain-containing protein [Capsulimonas sp.]|uniref:ankyrin repeat domain-containing protein n=1 Tax=Capsulimonas sp. TaxID=2494211 RepID=UPI00326666C3
MKQKRAPKEYTLPELFRKYDTDADEFMGDCTDPNQRRSDDDTLLHVISFRGGSVEELEFVVASGGDINAIGDIGLTPLHNAAMRGHEAIVRRLLELGADRAIRDEFGGTARDWANNAGHTEIAHLLA